MGLKDNFILPLNSVVSEESEYNFEEKGGNWVLRLEL